MNKYHAHRTTVNGIRFDSLSEAARYQQLLLLERAGDITGLAVHPRYVLLEPFVYRGKKERAITYAPDFVYREGGKTIAEDVKGGPTATQLFAVKRKLFIHKYPDIELRIIET